MGEMENRKELMGGLALFGCAALAFGLANSPLQESYHMFWKSSFLGGISLLDWINDGLMVVFFFAMGVKIRQELICGELSSLPRASLPVLGALGGMILPALIYVFFNMGVQGDAVGGQFSLRGWGIPVATDIAFALGVLTLLGSRVSSSLKIFLMALAIADDIGAILVVALFYTTQISELYCGLGFGLLAFLWMLSRWGVRNSIVYSIVSFLVWITFLKSGVHTTVAGVLLAFIIPSELGVAFEAKIHSWILFLILPLFALANTQVSLSREVFFYPVGLGVFIGLLLGKPLGISLFSWAGVRWGFSSLPEGVGWAQFCALSILGGMGFTMSLFISNLAFGGRGGEGAVLSRSIDPFILAQWSNTSKISILAASLASGLFGAGALWVLFLFRNQGVDRSVQIGTKQE